MAAHRLSGGKATLIVLIIPMIFVILGVAGILIFTGGEILASLADGLDLFSGSGGGRRTRTRAGDE